MCDFLQIGVRTGREDCLCAFREAGYHVAPSRPSIKATSQWPSLESPADFSFFEVTRGGCSCGIFYLWDEREILNEIRGRFERKNWSDAKKNRAIADASRAPRVQEALARNRATLLLLEQLVDCAGSAIVLIYDPDVDEPKSAKSPKPTPLTLGDLLESPGLLESGVPFLIQAAGKTPHHRSTRT